MGSVYDGTRTSAGVNHPRSVRSGDSPITKSSCIPHIYATMASNRTYPATCHHSGDNGRSIPGLWSCRCAGSGRAATSKFHGTLERVGGSLPGWISTDGASVLSGWTAALLVWSGCLEHSTGVAADRAEDLVGGLGPDEGFGVGVPAGYPVGDVVGRPRRPRRRYQRHAAARTPWPGWRRRGVPGRHEEP